MLTRSALPTLAVKASLTITSVLALTLAGLPAAHAAGAHPAKAPTLHEHCLIGTWRDVSERTTTQWNGSIVAMRSGGGDVDHISADGTDHNSYGKAKPLIGRYRGHRLAERVRGVNLQRMSTTGHGKHARVTLHERGWSASSSIHFSYRGHRSTGYLNQAGVHSYHYTCTAKTLTYFGKKGTVLETEARVRDRAGRGP
jgi:hypothetical protein